jgi:hypothetical protein
MNLNPFQNIRRWSRKNFPDPDQSKGLRHLGETETDRDLQKPVQQLLCDVHEECLNPLPPNDTNEKLIILQLQRLVGAQKRMVSLQAVSAFQSSRTNALIFWLTLIIVIQTFFLIWLALFPSQTFTSPAYQPQVVTDTNAITAATIQRTEVIRKTVEKYRIEEAVWNEGAKVPRAPLRSPEESLNPQYQKNFDLHKDRYLDSEGYFSPKGSHWKNWKLETRVAAICMWKDKERKLSPALIDSLITKIDAYFSDHSDTEAVLTVLNAVLEL